MEAVPVRVHLVPALVKADELAGGVAVVIDVLRATTTMVHALAAGCDAVRPCLEVEEARQLAASLPGALLGGERHGEPLPGFDLGNSPGDYTPERCRGRTLVLTTTNGTRALLHAARADRVLAAAFANFSAVGEHLVGADRPIHIVCAGSEGAVSLEDTLLAGGLAAAVGAHRPVALDDGAHLARAAFAEAAGSVAAWLPRGAGGVRLRDLGYDEDVTTAARVDTYALVPELRREPFRVEIGARGSGRSYWPARAS